MKEELLRIHQFLPTSRANGPGLRAVLWVQGCTLGCPGCFNPLTHTTQTGDVVSVDDIFQKILQQNTRIEGITVSGGEPLQQRRPLEQLLQRVRAETKLSILVFSGYTRTEIDLMPHSETFLNNIDVLLAGRYDQRQRLASGLIGSSNKTIHFLTDRYTQNDLQAIPQAEVILTPEGDIVLSGIDPLQW